MNYKIYTLAIAVAIGSISAFTLFNSNEGPSYTPKESLAFKEAVGQHDIAIAYNRLIKGDENGNISEKDVFKSRQALQKFNSSSSKADGLGIIWEPKGPINIGGRTRALVVDRHVKNRLVAGAVGGGVYVSTNAGQSWWAKHIGECNLIADIAQTADGSFFVGTGPALDDWSGSNLATSHTADNVIGTGIYRMKTVYDPYEKVQDVEETVDKVYTKITRMVAHPTDPNILFVGTFTGGLRVTKNATAANPTFEKVTSIPVARVVDVDISPDGNTVLATTGSSNGAAQVWRSTDGGNNFTQALVLSQSSGRAECAIAPSDGNYAYLLVAGSNSCLFNIYQSSNGGEDWDIIAAGGTQGNNSTFDPFANKGVNCQGNYDNTIAVFPDNPGKILIGGVHLYQGTQLPNSDPPLFGWSLVATTNGGPSSSAGFYVHADKHRIVIPDPKTIYIGTDGGVYKSADGGNLWSQNNLGYSTSQFYSLAIAPQTGPFDIVMGGTQDNGTLLAGFPFQGSTNPNYAFEVQGGDGFDCEFTTVDFLSFATSQNGALLRWDGNDFSSSPIWDAELASLCAGGCGEFYSAIEYWETTDAKVPYWEVWYHAQEPVQVGDTIYYGSATNQYPLKTVSMQTLNPGDSMLVPDKVQHQLSMANIRDNNGYKSVFLTKEAGMRAGGSPRWTMVAGKASYPNPPGENESILEMLYSSDGNHLFLGSTSGNLYRISNLLYGYGDINGDIRSSGCVLTCTRINPTNSIGGTITGIAIDPNDNEHLIVTIGGYNRTASIYRITNALTATTGNAAITPINGNFTDIPVYDAEIDLTDGDKVLIGTQYGVFSTDKAFTGSGPGMEWTEENLGMNRFPVYEIKQQIQPTAYNFDLEQVVPALNYKAYYVSTHGAGFFKTSSLVGIDDRGGETKRKFNINLKVYPNPVRENSKIEFTLESSANSTIQIFDLKGQMVNEMQLGKLPAGKQQLQLNTSALSAGTYFVRLTAGEANEVAKIIKTQ